MKTSKLKYVLVGLVTVLFLSTGAWADGKKIDRQKVSKTPQYNSQHNNGNQHPTADRNPGHGGYNNHQPSHRHPQGHGNHGWNRRPHDHHSFGHHKHHHSHGHYTPQYQRRPDYRPLHDAFVLSAQILDPAFALSIITGHRR